MMRRMGLCWNALLLGVVMAAAAMPHDATAATKKKAAPAATHGKKTAASSKGTVTAKGKASKTSARRGSTNVIHYKKGRVPRTHRVIVVSPVVRESAIDRVENYLTESSDSPFLYTNALAPFFKALTEEQASLKAGRNDRTVRILQFGDSHTAADIFTGEMRARMQQQFGDGGLGFQYAGHPFAGYKLAGSSRSQTEGWFTEGNKFLDLGDGNLGMGGLSISTTRPNQSITLETSCTTLQLHFLQQTGGGRLQFTDNGAAVSTIETGVEGASGAGTFSYSCTPGVHDFEFTTMDEAPVKLLGLVTEQPGVTYECIGINGAVAPLMLRWNQDLFATYLRQRDPSLIVLAYGTNEASQSTEHLETYSEEFGRILDNLHRIVPGASILVIGPEDRATATHRAWHAFPGTERIIGAQKEACRLHGCAYWDTRRRMGGFGSMMQWVAAGWAQPDRTHLTGTGYRELAAALHSDLMRAYNVYQQHTSSTFQESRNGKAPGHP